MRKSIFLITFLFFIILPKKAWAVNNFDTDYNVTYSVNSNASTHVSIEGKLTNKTSQYYASAYKIVVGFKELENIRASDGNGPISPKITKGAQGSDIDLSFNQKVLGLGSKLTFNISFDTKEVAQNTGQLWEINIPGLSSVNDFTSFNATVVYPSFLSQPAYIKPNIEGVNNRGNSLTFSKNQLGTSGISIAFGDFQIYDFNLTYNIGNKNLFPVKTEIALPPSTNYQDVEISSIKPLPNNVTLDDDGNWLAQYTLLPSQKLKILATGKAKVFLNPKKEPISQKQLEEYLKEQPYWQTNNQKIISLARELKTPEAIYNYVVKNLNYDYSRVTEERPRLGALNVLNNPKSAVCLEFTDLYIALSRAAGIPARELDGYAYTQNSTERPLSLGLQNDNQDTEDILHAWPEYYDSKSQSWIMVDPTWGNTTGGIDYFNVLDFDHFAFVIKGNNSDYPVPAGGYKLDSNKKTKDVSVKLGENFNEQKILKTSFFLADSLYTLLPIQGQVRVENVGNSISDPQYIQINTGFLTPTSQTINLDKVPPFGYLEKNIAFNKMPVLTNKSDLITIQVGKDKVEKSVKISPLFLNIWVLSGGGLLVIFGITISIIATRTRRLSFSKRE